MWPVITIFCSLLGLVVGLIVGYVLAERRMRAQLLQQQVSLASAEQRAVGLSEQLTAEHSQSAALRNQLSTAEKDCATLIAQLQAAQQNLTEQRQLLEQAQIQLREAFAVVSQEALAKNTEAFLQLAKQRFAQLSTEAAGSLEQRKAQIEGLLKPMQELLGQYQTRLGEIEKSRVESYSMLREQLGVLAETQRTLNTQTGQLVTALSRPATRGQWGEISLRRLVELAGMSSRCDFVQQPSLDTQDGRLRPDMIVHLPGGREVVIDCKTPLDAFLDAAAAPDEDVRQTCLARHAQHVRNRARELCAKSYWSQFPHSPEYVVMFMPGEGFLQAAAEQDPSLMEDCIARRVIVATPTTLIAILRAIEYGWRQQAMTENAEQIRALGVELYDRIAAVATHIDKLGGHLGNCVSAYNNVIGSVESRLLVTTRKMSELGARNEKEIAELSPVDVRPRQLPASLSSNAAE